MANSHVKVIAALNGLTDAEHPEAVDVLVWLLEQHHGSTLEVSRHLSVSHRSTKEFLYGCGLGKLPAQIRAREETARLLPDYPFGDGMGGNEDVRGE